MLLLEIGSAFTHAFFQRSFDMPTAIALKKLDKKITALSDALARLGKGTDLRDLIRIIRFPGWTTPAELAFTVAILDSMQSQVDQLTKMSGALAAAAKRVSTEGG
jgi:hypothetical protein